MNLADNRVQIALWIGIPALLLFSYIFFIDAGDAIQRTERSVANLHDEYEQLYVRVEQPAQPVEAARDEIADRLQSQERQLQLVEDALVPPLPAAYATSRYPDAQALLQRDIDAVRSLSQRSGVAVPDTFPVTTLETDPSAFSLQLAQVHLVRQVVESLLVHVRSIDGWQLATPWRDPSGSYATLPIDLQLECDPAGYERVLDTLLHHSGGLGLGAFSLTALEAGRFRVDCRVTLLTPLQPGWSLETRSGGGRTEPGRSSSGRRRR